MPYVALMIVIAGFVAGVFATRRFAPPLAGSLEGRLAFWIVAIRTGTAVGVIVDALWLAV